MAQSTLSKIMPSTASAAAKTNRKRPDIQGLRAVAVLAVVANHLTGFPGGGFVGVDIFFVISGFLITGLLLREHEKTGAISFGDFYRRRIRRIMPVAALVILVTVAASYAIYRAGRATSILTDGVWSMLFAGNWRFAIAGTDYWAEDGPVSPLQHYWSLGVEEQYYFVWPVVIALVLAASSVWRVKLSGLFALQIAISIFIAASLVWSLHESATNPGFAYFSTFSRAWELGLGALIALLAKRFHEIPSTVRPLIAWVGLAGIAASLIWIRGESSFPAPLALLPVVSTALVIVAGTGGSQRFIAPLTNRVSSYVGDISYSLYLWHFPVIILLGEVFPEEMLFRDILLLGVMFAISALSYHFVEDRILQSSWLGPQSRGRRGSQRRLRDSQRLKYVSLASLAVATAVVTTLALVPSTPQQEATLTKPAPTLSTLGKSEAAKSNQALLTEKLQVALAAESWPELAPSLDDVLQDGRPNEEEAAGCGGTVVSDPNSCNFSAGAGMSAVVYGDSTAITLLPTVRAALGKDYDIRGLSMAGCITLDIQVKVGDAAEQARCDQFKVDAMAEIFRQKPDVVFLSNTAAAAYQRASEGPVAEGSAEMEAGTKSVLQELAKSGAKVIVVPAPPTGIPLATCATRTSSPADCKYEVNPGYGVYAEASKKAAAATNSSYLDTLPWFCVQSRYCPSFVDSTPIKRDGNHTTKQYAALLAPVFKDAFTAAMQN